MVEVIDQSAHRPAATALGTVLACQVAGPDVVDARYRRMARSLQAGAVLTPLGDRAWGHRSFSVRSPAGAEVVIYAERFLEADE